MNNFKNKKYIIWDWNGTLLNDAEFCVECMNIVLRKHNIETIDLHKYKKFFTFPVKDYYQAIGFDFTKVDFEEPAMEFIDHYYSNIGKANLHESAADILSFFKEQGIRQFSLSAMEHSQLIISLTSKGIIDYFEEIHGINNHYAHSKLEMGQELMKKLDAPINEILLIGDTIHDFEVASSLGIDCLLVSNGHQSLSKLQTVTDNIISDLSEIRKLF